MTVTPRLKNSHIFSKKCFSNIWGENLQGLKNKNNYISLKKHLMFVFSFYVFWFIFFQYFMFALESISAKVFTVLYSVWKLFQLNFKYFIFNMKTISDKERKIPILAFVRVRRGQNVALGKKLLEHFTTIFGILNDINV